MSGRAASRLNHPSSFALSSLRRKITLRIGEDHIAHRLMIFDVARATAEMAVQRLGDGFLKLGARHALSRQTFEQHLAFVEEAGRAVTALKGKMIADSYLQNRTHAVTVN